MLQLKVEAIKWESPDTATFFFSEISGKKISYNAGQFITLVFNRYGEEIRRSYSLSSSPDEPLLAITVKRMANGEISRFLLAKAKKGNVLTAVEPAGRFIITDFKQKKDIFVFAAGSGIVPLFSQLKYILNRKGKSNITLIYSNRHEKSVLFKDEINNLFIKHPGRFKFVDLVSTEGNRLTNQIVEKLVNEKLKNGLNKASFYTCGPFDYMRMVRLTLLYMGFEPAQIRKENFVLETAPVSNEAANYPPRRIKLHFHQDVYDLIVGENQSILKAALQNNIPLPYSCQVGDCSACAAICKSGKVEMAKNNVLTDADLAAGWILTCTGHPFTSNVVIEF